MPESGVLPAWAVWGAVFGWTAGTPGFLWPLEGWGGWPLWLALALPGTAWQLWLLVGWLGSGWGLRHRPVRARTLYLVNAARSEAGAAPVMLVGMLVAQRQADGLLRDCVLSH